MLLFPASCFSLSPIWLLWEQLFFAMWCCFFGIVYGIRGGQLIRLSQLGFFFEFLWKRYPVMREMHEASMGVRGGRESLGDPWMSSCLQFSLRSSSFVWLSCLVRYSNTFPVFPSPLLIYLNSFILDLCNLQQTALMNILTGSHLLHVQEKIKL